MCITTTKGSVMSRFDSLPIHYMVVRPEHPKAVVQIVHGMCEYKERYTDFMLFLAEHGYAVAIHDHRGHGESVKSPDDYGFFYSGGYRAVIDDVKTVNEWIRREFAGLPIFLFGHSMGSLAVRSYLKRCPETVDGLVVCGSPSYNSYAPVAKRLVRSMAVIHGRKHRSRRIQELCFRSYADKFGEGHSRNVWLSSDADVVRKYDEDNKCNFIFTLNGFSNLFSLMIDAYSSEGWKVTNPGMPIYFVSGAHDPCAISRDDFENAADMMRKIGYRNVTSHLYDNMRHEILNEKGRQTVYEDLLHLFDGWYIKLKQQKL